MAGPIRIAILANGRQARAEIQRTAASADLFGKSVSRVGKLLVAGFAVDRLVRAASAVVKVGGEYVTTLNKIEAVTGASQRQIDKGASTLEAQARQFAAMGQTTGDAAAGTLELAKAGLSLDKSLKAVYPTMILAKAGQLEVADASTLVANTLNTFNLKASEAEHIANSLANAANASSSDVSDLAESFKYVAPLAAKSGVTLDQTNAILAELSNSGIKASQAGTGLRKFLASLQAPAGAAKEALKGLNVEVFDAQGKMRPLGPIVDDLRAGLDKLTQKDQAKALRDIFGLQGITPAQVILKEGSKGLNEYVKAVERAGGAAELAKASSKGLAGTLSSLRAATISEADALYRKYSPAVDQALQRVIKSAKAELPAALDAAKSAAHDLIPALESLADLAVDLARDVGDLATGPLGQAFVGSMKILIGLTKEAADFLGSIPEPIRKIGIEAALAALILPRLTASVGSATASLRTQMVTMQQWRAEMTYGVTRTQNLAAATARLGAAAKTAAGIGGMLALADSANRTNKGLSTLEAAAGGALLGFSVGGPWGAAIGAGAGGMFGLMRATDDAASSFQLAKPKAADFVDTLNEVSGAATSATQKLIALTLQQNGAFEAGRSLGLSTRDLVRFMQGVPESVKKVNAALQQGTADTIRWTDQYGVAHEVVGQTGTAAAKLNTILGVNARKLSEDTAKAQELAVASGDLRKALKGVQDRGKIVTDFETNGYPETTRDIANLVDKYDLARKDVKTLIKASGVPTTLADVQQVLDRLAKVKDKTVTITVKTNRIGGVTSSQGGHSSDPLRRSSGVDPFTQSIINSAQQGSEGVRKALEKLSDYIDKGFSKRLARIKKELDKTLDGKALDKAVEKASDRLDKQQKRLMQRTKDIRRALNAQAKAIDANNQSLSDARDALAQLQQQATDYANSIRDSFLAFGNIVSLGDGIGFSSAAGLVELLKAKVEQAKQFAAIIKSLTAAGLNQTAIQQLIDAGVEGGLGTAQAILAGGPEAVSQINALQGELAAQGASLGQATADSLYSAGIQAAQGLVDGLAANADELAKQATKLAKALVKAVKKALGIQSPSRVFKKLGKQTVQGLALGLDDIYVKRQGAALASSLQEGFGSPALAAFIEARAARQKQTVEVKFTAQQIDALSRGRAIQADLDAWAERGGRVSL